MTDASRGGESTDGVDRRSLLKGTAAAGLAGAGVAGTASAGGWNEITFCAAAEENFSYAVHVTGRIKRGGTYESDSWDTVGDDFAEGAASEERCDSFLFTGEVEELELGGPGKVFVNGDLFEDTTDDRHELPNSITVQADGEIVDYKFRVSGRVEKGEFADADDDVDGNVVRGAVGGSGKDDYRYSGSLAFDSSDGPLTVTLHLGDD